MFGFLLLILKVIGYLLLGLTGLLFLAFFLILFVPIRYQASGSMDSDIYAGAKVTWLFSLIQIRIHYWETIVYECYLLGIPIFHSGKVPKERKPKQKNPKQKKVKKHINETNIEETNIEIEEIKERESQTLDHDNTEDIQSQSIQKPPLEPIEPRDEGESKKQNFFTKILEGIKDTWARIHAFFKSLKTGTEKVREKITFYKELWSKEETKCAFSLCKSQLSKILRKFRPNIFLIRIHFGNGDPAFVGNIVVYYSMFYAILGNHILLEPEYLDSVFDSDFYLKGKLTLFVLVAVTIRIYFDKNIRYLIKTIKKEGL